MALLRSRTEPPYIRPNPLDPNADERLIILPSETTSATNSTTTPPGRPIGPAYHSLSHKLHFMNTHAISLSILSPANPWLDFLPPEHAVQTARDLNTDLQNLCASPQAQNRFYAFALLPLSAPSTADIVEEIHRLASPANPHIKGVILSTSGLGSGLDDPALSPIWHALQNSNLLLFLHPHYGLPDSVYGPRAEEYGHVLPLALGFPLETTVAVTRMFLSGVLERFPGLRVLLAHAGGAVPFLAGRVESCVRHDGKLAGEGTRGRSLAQVLRENVFLDAVVYGDVGVKAAVGVVGADRVLFGTDHPFFPPLGKGEEEGTWESVRSNEAAVEEAFAGDEGAREAVMGGNALRVLGIE